ncbi:MAG: hypothetical protein RL885_24510 [Planctomycetota bacterium]
MTAKLSRIALGLLALSPWAFSQEGQETPPPKPAGEAAQEHPAPVAQPEAPAPADWSQAKEGKTEHYLVYSLQSEQEAKEVANTLESLFGKYKQFLKPDYDAEGQMSVLIFPDLANYNSFGDEFGGAASSSYAAYCPEDHPEKPVAVLGSQGLAYTKLYAAHGATKQFLRKAYPNRVPPSWIEDGLASMFEVQIAYQWSAKVLEDMKANDNFIPFDQLLRPGNTDFSRQRVSELGLLFYYLIHICEDSKAYIDPITNKTKQPFVDYLQMQLEGKNVSDLDVHKLLTDPERRKKLEEEFKAYKFINQ